MGLEFFALLLIPLSSCTLLGAPINFPELTDVLYVFFILLKMIF